MTDEEQQACFAEREQELQGARLAARDPKLPEREQQDAFAQALRRAGAGHPAVDNHEKAAAGS